MLTRSNVGVCPEDGKPTSGLGLCHWSLDRLARNAPGWLGLDPGSFFRDKK